MNMEKYFKIFCKLAKQFDLVSTNIKNINKTKFRIDYKKPQQIITNNVTKALIITGLDY